MFHFWPNAVIRGFFKLFTSFIAVILPTFYDAKKKKRKIKSLLAPRKITPGSSLQTEEEAGLP